MTRTLHLIKHARPQIVPGVPAHEWTLADDALAALPELIGRLDPRPGIVISSEEPKARATAEALAAALGAPQRAMLGLHEHLRYTNEVVSDEEFRTRLQLFFTRPEKLVVGEESAADARSRFSNAVNAVMRANAQASVAVVAHGTVISLLVAHANGLDPFELWTTLNLPDVVSVQWPSLTLREPTA